MTKVLWHSNSPWANTGYGVQTALFAHRLKQAGYDIHVSAYYGLESNTIVWNDIPIKPGHQADPFGNNMLLGHAAAHFGEPRGGLVLTLMDVWVLDPAVIRQMKVASWCPVDHDPLPPKVERYFEESGAIPIAMSRFGAEMLEKYDPLYVPHAVDTSIYRPHPKENARKKSGISQDSFVVGMVAANQGIPSRKCFPQSLLAFKAFHERHDDAVLMLHTNIREGSGVNLGHLVVQLGLEDAVVWTDQYRYVYAPLSPKQMAGWVYSAFDVLLNPSAGEGFGVPIIEAQACGVPAIVTDFSAMKETCGAGWKVSYRPFYTYQGSYQTDPDVEDIVEALESAYRQPKAARDKMSRQAREHAMTYDANRVMEEHMVPALTEIEERIGSVPKLVAA